MHAGGIGDGVEDTHIWEYQISCEALELLYSQIKVPITLKCTQYLCKRNRVISKLICSLDMHVYHQVTVTVKSQYSDHSVRQPLSYCFVCMLLYCP